MGEIDSLANRPDPLLEGVIGFVWTLIGSLLILGGGAVLALAVGTHLLIRLRPDVVTVITYDPSTVATFAFIPVLAGLTLLGLYLLRLRRRRPSPSR